MANIDNRRFEVVITVHVTVEAPTAEAAKAFAQDGLGGICHQFVDLPGVFLNHGWEDGDVTVTDIGPATECEENDA